MAKKHVEIGLSYAFSSTSKASPCVKTSFSSCDPFKLSLGIWDTAFAFLAVDRELSEVVLSFRGSETLTQLLEEIVHHALVPWPGAPEARSP